MEERAERVALSSVVVPASSVSCRSTLFRTALQKRLCPSGLRGAWHGNKQQLTNQQQLTKQLTRLGTMPERLNKQLTRLVKMPERLSKV